MMNRMEELLKHREKEELLNLVIALLGVIFAIAGGLLKSHSVIMTIFLSIGTSLLASSIVSLLNAKYLAKNENLKILLTKWRILSLYETKGEMNIDSNEALEQCEESIDIIAEGMHNFLTAKGPLLSEKSSTGVKIRIISCDNLEMLTQRSKDESLTGQDITDRPDELVKQLDKWVKDQKEGNPKRDLTIRFHSTYPGFSYLKVDSAVFVSPNLWLKASQQSFALSFSSKGIGGQFFSEYFESLWNNRTFLHDDCKLQETVSQ